jgi:hypothetical protein
MMDGMKMRKGRNAGDDGDGDGDGDDDDDDDDEGDDDMKNIESPGSDEPSMAPA